MRKLAAFNWIDKKEQRVWVVSDGEDLKVFVDKCSADVKIKAPCSFGFFDS